LPPDVGNPHFQGFPASLSLPGYSGRLVTAPLSAPPLTAFSKSPSSVWR